MVTGIFSPRRLMLVSSMVRRELPFVVGGLLNFGDAAGDRGALTKDDHAVDDEVGGEGAGEEFPLLRGGAVEGLVMRMGSVVSSGTVMLRKAGGGGGGGGGGGAGAGASTCGGGAEATSGATVSTGGVVGPGGLWERVSAWQRPEVLVWGRLGGGATGGGGGVACATAAGAGACTVRLLTTVLMPVTWEASAAARERAASLLTVPLRVAT